MRMRRPSAAAARCSKNAMLASPAIGIFHRFPFLEPVDPLT
jgi:hypothetical protein